MPTFYHSFYHPLLRQGHDLHETRMDAGGKYAEHRDHQIRFAQSEVFGNVIKHTDVATGAQLGLTSILSPNREDHYANSHQILGRTDIYRDRKGQVSRIRHTDYLGTGPNAGIKGPKKVSYSLPKKNNTLIWTPRSPHLVRNIVAAAAAAITAACFVKAYVDDSFGATIPGSMPSESRATVSGGSNHFSAQLCPDLSHPVIDAKHGWVKVGAEVTVADQWSQDPAARHYQKPAPATHQPLTARIS